MNGPTTSTVTEDHGTSSTEGGQSNLILPNDALDKAADIIGATCDGYVSIKIEGDAVVEEQKDIKTGEEMATIKFEGDAVVEEQEDIETGEEMATVNLTLESGNLKRKSLSDKVKISTIERNKALAAYYKSKRTQEEEFKALKRRKLELEIDEYLRRSCRNE